MRALVFTLCVIVVGFVILGFPRYTIPASYPALQLPLKNDLTVGWVGDMVPSDDSLYNALAFSNVTPFLQQPDLMIGNLEGTFATTDAASKCTYLKLQCHTFRGSATFADALKSAGFDVVSLVNNHSYDFGPFGLTETEAELTRVGIPYISPTKPTLSITVHGKHIGILGLSSTPPAETISNYTYIKHQVALLKASNDIVIVIFHGGAEGTDQTAVPGTDEYMGTENRGNVALVAQTALDAGATMVLGSGPHVLRKIEMAHGSLAAYSLGNFVGGRHLLTTDKLGISAILTANLNNNTVSGYLIQSIQLSPDGMPMRDYTEQGKLLIEQLSK
jgi:poly-gamma-glutamate capsule biosynthesis protein CapA/YwtB (metallophosphatase superfamily)